jgi:hypothetical protein
MTFKEKYFHYSDIKKTIDKLFAEFVSRMVLDEIVKQMIEHEPNYSVNVVDLRFHSFLGDVEKEKEVNQVLKFNGFNNKFRFTVGVPDFLIYSKGICKFIEVKSEVDVLRNVQKKWIEDHPEYEVEIWKLKEDDKND